jgi:uncharacterized protein (DUF2342 family)
MTELEALRSYRTGQTDRATVLARFTAAGWDETDVKLLMDNVHFDRAPQRDLVQEFIDRRRAQRGQQSNPLKRNIR